MAVHYHRADWEDGRVAPYQVELDCGILVFVPTDTDDLCKAVERAWWEPVFREHKDAHRDRRIFDRPGRYLVVAPTWISGSLVRGGEQVADAFPPLRLHVTEVQISLDRVRGRTAQPEGWISLRSTDDEKVFAVPDDSAYARCFREANPGLFVDEDECTDPACGSSACRVAAAQCNGHLCVERLRSCRAGTADPDQRDERGQTALLSAVRRRWIEGVKVLLAMSADANLGDACEDRRPLHHAVQECHEAVPLLLQARADPNLQDRNVATDPNAKSRSFQQSQLHRTALHYAAEAGHGDITKALLQARASPDLRDGLCKVPLHLAIAEKHEEVVDILLSGNADVNLGNLQVGQQFSPLMDAVYRNDCSLAQKLIAARADLNMTGKSGMTALHLSVRAQREELSRLLVASACDTSIEALGMTAADFALKNKNVALAQLLGAQTSAEEIQLEHKRSKVNKELQDPLLRAELYID